MWWVGTRKGLFRVDEGGEVERVHFLGIPVPLVLVHGNQVWAALEHGHYGAKLHRSDDGGATFQEVATPAFDAGEPGDPSVSTVWALERGGDGRLWLGTIPGGLFTSFDEGASWTLVRALWDRPERAEWFGGGADLPGIHSICIHPEDPNDVVIGVSCGHCFNASWMAGKATQ